MGCATTPLGLDRPLQIWNANTNLLVVTVLSRSIGSMKSGSYRIWLDVAERGHCSVIHVCMRT